MKYVELNNTIYGFVRDFKDIQELRLSFNKMTETIFGFSLENWYQNGFWANYYIPYSLLHNNEIVSNVSINIIEFDIENERKKGIQIGTVMTYEKYRHKGLCKFLMEEVLNEWKEQADFIYLFANDSVLDFYPKFNFEIVKEYQYSKLLEPYKKPSAVRRLNVEDQNDRTFLIDTITSCPPTSKVSMLNNAPLLMFYCLLYKKNCIYFLEKLNVIVIADYEEDILYLNDVFSKGTVDLNEVIESMTGKNIKKVVLGFTPINEAGFNKSLVKDGDTLFMLGDMLGYFKDHTLRFPILSRA